jgi:riboflavin biosynthesis pyrimidine reductase
MKPHVICHMLISLDGRIHPSRWTQSPDGDRGVWSSAYERVHETLAGDAWLVGRVTMAEMSKAVAHPPEGPFAVTRPHHFARHDADTVSYVVAADEGMDARPLLELLGKELGIQRLLVEGGGNVNGSMMAAGVVDELSILLAPAVDGAVGITGVFEVPDARGLAGKARLRLTSSETIEHGLVHLRYAVEPT